MSRNSKITQISNELLELAKNLGITIRRDNGNFRGGYCLLKDRPFIIINKSVPKETIPNIIAQCLGQSKLEDVYIKPVIRDFIEKNSSQDFDDIELNILKEN